MSITLILPGSLKKWLKDRSETECHGKTVGECIDNIDKEFPGFKKRIVDENGELSSDIFVFLNGDNISGLDKLATSVKDGDEIGIIPFAAGG